MSGAAGEGRVRGAVVALLFLVALVLRLPNLDAGPWFDEVWFAVEYLRRPFGELVRTYDSDNLHPLYAWVAWPCVRLLGESALAARIPALLFGAASVPLVYVFGARGGSARAGLLAALLLALAPHHVAFSQSARGYTGLLFFTLLSCIGFRAALRRGSARDVALQGVPLGLATHVHTTGVFLALAQAVALGVELAAGRRHGRRVPLAPLSGVVLGGAVSLALHAPILSAMLAFFTREKDAFAATRSEWKEPLWMVREMARSFGVGELPGLLLLAGGAAVLLCGLAVAWRRDRPLALMAVLPAVLGQGTMWLFGRNLWPRFFFSLAGFWLLLAVLGTDAVCARALAERGRRVATGLVVAVMAVFALLTLRVWRLPKQDFAGAIAWIEEHDGDGAPVMTAGLAMYPLREWYGKDWAIVEDPAAIDAALAGRSRGLVVLSSERYTSAYYPEVWAALVERGREVARFPAWSADQAVVVLEVGP